MQGKIVLANSGRGRYGVQVETRDFMGFEMLKATVLELGDTVTGDLEAVAGETLRSAAQSDISIFIQIAQGSRGQIQRWVG